MKIRVVLQDVEVEWSSSKHVEDTRHPAAMAFAAAAAPYVVDWLRKQGFTFFDRDKPPAAAASSASSEPPASEEEESETGQHVVDGEPSRPNHASAEV